MIDIIFAIAVIFAFYWGFKKGIIHAVLSLAAIFLGILFAINFSALAANFISANFNLPPIVLPVLSFVIVLFSVIIVIKLAATILEKMLKAVMLNFTNKIAGGVLYGVAAALIFSTLFWMVDKTGVVTQGAREASISYPYMVGFAPAIYDGIGSLLPILKETFHNLNELFGQKAREYSNGL